MNILAVGAHPDDVEVNCAGTLAKYAAQGHKVFICTATSGNIGSATLSKEEIGAIRKAEAAKSAAIIGAEYICLDYDDEFLYDDPSVRIKFINMVRHCKPDVIFTHNLKDYNPDHERTGKIITDIQVMYPIAKIITEEPPCDILPAVYYFEPSRGLNFIPTDYVDITDYYETKKQMLLCHESQVQWMMDNFKGRNITEDHFTDSIYIMGRYRGKQCDVQFAEAFVRANDGYKVKPGSLLP